MNPETTAARKQKESVVSGEPYGDGLVFVVRDDLQCEVWLDRAWIGDVGLGRLDQFIALRKYLAEVDNVAVLTEGEAENVREAIKDASRCA